MRIKIAILILISSIGFCYGQDIRDPYRNLQASTIFDWQIWSNSWNQPYSLMRPGYLGPYSGEYQILPDIFPWNQFLNSNLISITYNMEVVSFPFETECAYLPLGCVGKPNVPLTIREMKMPKFQYNASNLKWGELSNKLPSDLLLDNSNTNSNRQTLISKSFVADYPFSSTMNAKLLPHTSIKHTLYVHCGPSTNPLGPIIYSISWIYDNTRGRMRYYPPCITGCNSDDWDIAYYPELLIVKYPSSHPYNYAISNNILNDGAIDNFPFSDLFNLPQCSFLGANPIYNSNFNSFSVYNYIFFPSYSVLTSPARQARGKQIAGYVEDQVNPQNYLVMGGIQHHYFIDTDFNLNDINPIDRVIYNPSDVTITAANLHYPTGYTFKTIRGVYPSDVEVNRDNTGDNGGPYTDLRQVPVITDLRCEDPLFPHDPAILDDAKYSSLYRLASGSKLTIDPCVTVYDAAFILDAGSTLDFANYNSFRGLPRIAIDRNGGRLIKRFVPTNIAQTLYLQNETKTTNKPDSYFIEGKIEAGKNVDGNQPPGNYIVDANAGLELVASEYIAFKEGFSAKTNSNLSARIDNSLSIPQCRIANSGNRIALNTISSQQNVATIQTKNTCNISVYPSIFSSNITIDFPASSGVKKLVIYDALGKIVYHLNADNFTSPIELSQLNDGIYFVKIESESCNSFSKTIVKNGGK